MAHDEGRIYLAIRVDEARPISSDYQIYFDTDRSRGTGFIGTGGNYSIGAELAIIGNQIYRYMGGAGGTDWSWTPTGVAVIVSVAQSSVELSFPRDSLSLTGSTRLFFLSTNSAAGGVPADSYPDGALASGSGRFAFTYVIEP
jgi:hypothetical protein